MNITPQTKSAVERRTMVRTTRRMFRSTAGAKKAQNCQMMIGKARASAAMRQTLIVVVNGSVTPSVTSFFPGAAARSANR